MNKMLFSISLLFVCSLQCTMVRSSIKPDIDFKSLKSVLVMPFENLTADVNAGEIVSEIFINEISASGKLSILASPQLNQKIAELVDSQATQQQRTQATARQSPIARSVSNTEEVQAAFTYAHQLHADAVIFGKVVEYRYKKGLSESPVCGISVRLVSYPDLQTLWSSSISVSEPRFSWHESSLSDLCQQACKKLIQTITYH